MRVIHSCMRLSRRDDAKGAVAEELNEFSHRDHQGELMTDKVSFPRTSDREERHRLPFPPTQRETHWFSKPEDQDRG